MENTSYLTSDEILKSLTNYPQHSMVNVVLIRKNGKSSRSCQLVRKDNSFITIYKKNNMLILSIG